MARTLVIPLLATLALFLAWMGGTASVAGDDQQVIAPAYAQEQNVSTLSAADSARLSLIESKRVHELSGHHELAEFMRLRKTSMRGWLPEASLDVAYYALMAIGQPYRLKAMSNDLSEADCVTFTERCIALACTDNWGAAYSLQNRLRFRDGQEAMPNRNRETILDWIPNNAWLFDEITASLEVPVTEFEIHFERRTSSTVYISKEQLPKAYPLLQTGDILLVIADQANPPSDPVTRTRCVHIAIIYKPSDTEPVQILHSYPPTACQWSLARLLKNPRVKGGKILRLKTNARQIVAAELARLDMSTSMNPADMDSKLRLKKGQFGFITPSRAPDFTIDIDGIRYGALRVRPSETLWSLFKGGWKGVANLEVNEAFMQRHPNLEATSYRDDSIYYPISRIDGDKTPF